MSFCICSVGNTFHALKTLKKDKRIFLQPLQSIIRNVMKEMHSGTPLSSNKNRWTEPEGHSTGITIFNSVTKSKVPLKTIHPNVLTWYNCGPTVYDSAHIGHGLNFVKLDIVRRILENVFKLQVIQVTNITDIDDKIINKARQLNESVKSLTQRYEEEFNEDMKKLNVRPPSITTRVTEYIPQIISFIQKLVDNGSAYNSEGSIYFDTVEYKNYGKFINVASDDEQIHRIVDERKKCPNDFALWKGSPAEGTFWNSPWGPGRPGWHIECSVMAYQVFGEKLDLHTGGIDLIFPHHENEDAQCCAHHNVDQWCNYWLHTGHLHVKGSTKMSKSLKNTITINDFLEKYSSNLFRLFCLFSHYRKPLEYTDGLMIRTEHQMKKVVGFLQLSHSYLTNQICCGPIDDQLILDKMIEVKRNIEICLADDFNTEGAMYQILDLIDVCSKQLSSTSKVIGAPRSLSTVTLVSEYIFKFFHSLGIKFKPHVPSAVHLVGTDMQFSRLLNATIQFRHAVKNFALLQGDQAIKNILKDELKAIQASRRPLMQSCDLLRSELNKYGIKVVDHGGVSSWSFIEEESGTDKKIVPKKVAQKKEN